MENNKEKQSAIIKVIGIGGGGGNAVQYMMEQELQGVELYCANTDIQALGSSLVKNQIQLGQEVTRGLGAGANPEIGKKAATEDREKIMRILEGTDMLFIAAGMGGGTGTGAAPVIAEIAKQAGVLTVAVITKPFYFEGSKRMKVADTGISELVKHVDSLITIPNDRLLSVMGKTASISQAFSTANSVLFGAVQGISDLILKQGVINVDFADVKTIMSTKGVAMMGAGISTGEDRAIQAAEKAISSPLLENIDLSGAKGLLVNITASPDFGIHEYNQIGEVMYESVDEDATVVIGLVTDKDIGDEARVTIVATGIGGMQQTNVASVAKQIPENKAETSKNTSQKVANSDIQKAKTISEEPRKTGLSDLDIPAFLRNKIKTDKNK